MMVERSFQVRLSHTDAAGVIFFPRLLEMAHESWEDFLAEAGMPLGKAMAQDGPMWPIVHCEADYRHPMRLGDPVRAQLWLEREGRSSITLGHRFLSPSGELLAEARTVHAAMDRQRGESVPLTEGMLRLLAVLRS